LSPSRAHDVVSVGILVADIFPSTLKRLPEPGELLPVERFVIQPGGCAANTSIGLAKLGVSTAVAGKVGADLFGDFVLDVLTDAGVDVRGVIRSNEFETSKTIVLTLEGEDRRFLHLFGANGALTGSEVSQTLLAGSRICYVGGFLAMSSFSAEDLVVLFGKARELGVTTVLDVVVPGAEADATIFEAVLPFVDYFLPNEDEGRAITGSGEPETQAAMFRDMGAGTVVITCGADGVIAEGVDGGFRCGTFDTEFVDGSGAGDAFDAGFITGLLESKSLEECVRMGSAMGASCVREIGCTTGLLGRDELDRFLAEHTRDAEVRSYQG